MLSCQLFKRGLDDGSNVKSGIDAAERLYNGALIVAKHDERLRCFGKIARGYMRYASDASDILGSRRAILRTTKTSKQEIVHGPFI